MAKKKVAFVETRILECFACGVLSSADLKNSFSFDANQVETDAHRAGSQEALAIKTRELRATASRWPECIVADQLPVLLNLAVP